MDRIKLHEGFVPKIYKDSLGFKTIGFGHLCKSDETWEEDKEYSKEHLELVFKTDFNNALSHANSLTCELELDERAKEVIIEMVFQLGIGGVMKFKMMWNALKDQNYSEAADQMLDSLWAKQTPKRAKSLSDVMRKCDEEIPI